MRLDCSKSSRPMQLLLFTGELLLIGCNSKIWIWLYRFLSDYNRGLCQFLLCCFLHQNYLIRVLYEQIKYYTIVKPIQKTTLRFLYKFYQKNILYLVVPIISNNLLTKCILSKLWVRMAFQKMIMARTLFELGLNCKFCSLCTSFWKSQNDCAVML